MNKHTQQRIVLRNMPYGEGTMRQTGQKTYETSTTVVTDYQTAFVPYIVYQEEGFTHYLSLQFVDKNQYFIRNNTIGELLYMNPVNPSAKKGIAKNMVGNGNFRRVV